MLGEGWASDDGVSDDDASGDGASDRALGAASLGAAKSGDGTSAAGVAVGGVAEASCRVTGAGLEASVPGRVWVDDVLVGRVAAPALDAPIPLNAAMARKTDAARNRDVDRDPAAERCSPAEAAFALRCPIPSAGAGRRSSVRACPHRSRELSRQIAPSRARASAAMTAKARVTTSSPLIVCSLVNRSSVHHERTTHARRTRTAVIAARAAARRACVAVSGRGGGHDISWSALAGHRIRREGQAVQVRQGNIRRRPSGGRRGTDERRGLHVMVSSDGLCREVSISDVWCPTMTIAPERGAEGVGEEVFFKTPS